VWFITSQKPGVSDLGHAPRAHEEGDVHCLSGGWPFMGQAAEKGDIKNTRSPQ
jgi:hypothetical protein